MLANQDGVGLFKDDDDASHPEGRTYVPASIAGSLFATKEERSLVWKRVKSGVLRTVVAAKLPWR